MPAPSNGPIIVMPEEESRRCLVSVVLDAAHAKHMSQQISQRYLNNVLCSVLLQTLEHEKLDSAVPIPVSKFLKKKKKVRPLCSQ